MYTIIFLAIHLIINLYYNFKKVVAYHSEMQFKILTHITYITTFQTLVKRFDTNVIDVPF